MIQIVIDTSIFFLIDIVVGLLGLGLVYTFRYEGLSKSNIILLGINSFCLIWGLLGIGGFV